MFPNRSGFGRTTWPSIGFVVHMPFWDDDTIWPMAPNVLVHVVLRVLGARLLNSRAGLQFVKLVEKRIFRQMPCAIAREVSTLLPQESQSAHACDGL